MSEESTERTPAVKDRIHLLRERLERWPEVNEDIFSSDAVTRAPWTKPEIQDVIKQMFSDVRLTVEDIIERRGRVVVHWRLQGTWAQPFLNIEATNKPVEFTGISTYRFDGDKIVESDGEFDLAGLAAQALGAGVTAQQCQEALQVLSRVNPSPV